MLIQACMIIRIQPFNQQFFCPLKSCCFQSKKLKIKLMKSRKNEANFADSQWFCSFFCFQSPHGSTLLCGQRDDIKGWHMHGCHSTLYYYSVLYYYWLFEILPPYSIISPYTIINFCRFGHPIPLFCPILLFRTSEYIILSSKHWKKCNWFSIVIVDQPARILQFSAWYDGHRLKLCMNRS